MVGKISFGKKLECETEQYLCVVCAHANVPKGYFRCGHSVCTSCVLKLNECPVCRGSIDDFVRVFM